MYAPPAYPPFDPNGPAAPVGPPGALTREQARSKLIVQGIALACVSGLLILVFLLDLFLFASGMPIGAGTPGVTPEMQEWVRPVTIAVCIFAALANVFNIVAAIQMIRVRSWGLALAGCIVAAIPLTSSACCLLTLPFSIWGIVQLVKPEVKAAFKLPA